MKINFLKGEVLTLALFLFIFIGCSKEESCPERYDMKTFELLSSTKQIFPYKDSLVRIVFRDSLGNEVTGLANRTNIIGFGSTGTNADCLYNTNEKIKVTAGIESIEQFVSIPDLDLGFKIGFGTRPNLTEYEDDFVHDAANILYTPTSEYSDPLYYPIPQIVIILHPRNDPSEHLSIPLTTHTILNQHFTNVFTNSQHTHIVKFYYNHELGILGFKEMPIGTTYVFDRFE